MAGLQGQGRAGSQIQLALDFVHHIVGGAVLGLDVDLAGLHPHLVGQAVVCLDPLDDVGDVVLAAAGFEIDLGRERRAAPPGGGLCGFRGFA